MRRLGFLVLILVCMQAANAAVVGVSPSVARFDNMLKGGYAQMEAVASTDNEAMLRAHFTIEGDIAEWITILPRDEDFVFSRSDPYEFTIIIQPHEDALNGNFTGIIKITTDELAVVTTGAGSSIIAEVGLLVFAEVTGDETIDCRAGAFSISDAEVGDPLRVSSLVYNDGNVRIKPEVRVDIYDQLETELLHSEEFIGSEILPTLDSIVYGTIEPDLLIGQYFAEIIVKQCGISGRATFDVVEEGGIADSGTFIGIRTNEVAYEKQPLPINPMFKNTGPREVLAQFKGEIRDLNSDKVVQVLESDRLEVNPSETIEFKMFYVPEKAGTYIISGRVVYNNKISFEDQSRTVKVIRTGGGGLGWLFYLIVYMIIGLLILILWGKIKKRR